MKRVTLLLIQVRYGRKDLVRNHILKSANAQFLTHLNVTQESS